MKTKILCGLCAVAVLLLSFSIFAAATHVNIKDDNAGVANLTPVSFGGFAGGNPSGIPGAGMMGGSRTTPEAGSGNGTMNGGMLPDGQGATDGGVVGGDGGTTDTPMQDPSNGDGVSNPDNGMTDGTNDGTENGTTDGNGAVDGTTDENGGIMDDVTDGVEDMLPETNVPDSDIGGAAPDTDGDGLTNTQDPDDDGDGLPDKADPDADGDKLDDTDESTGIVGIVLAVIIVLAIIVTILAVVPKKNKK